MRDYVREGTTDEVRCCASLLGEKAAQCRLVYLDLVNFVLAFTRGAIAWHPDRETDEHAQRIRYPVEVLIQKQGGSRDHVLLAAALLRQLGIDVMLWVLQLAGGQVHTAIAFAQRSSCPACTAAGLRGEVLLLRRLEPDRNLAFRGTTTGAGPAIAAQDLDPVGLTRHATCDLRPVLWNASVGSGSRQEGRFHAENDYGS